MKIYIMVDMEGISGISGKAYISNSCNRQDLIAKSREFMAKDINACVSGCFQAGATEVIVKDCHGGGGNVSRDMIDERADLIDGDTPQFRFADLDGSDGLILLGYHAMAGTLNAVLEHSMSSMTVQNYWINGRLSGEIGIDAAIAAEHGVKVIMVSGDDKTCAEAADWLNGVIVCEVKKSFSCNGVRMKSLTYTRNLIKDKTMEAIARIEKIPFLKIKYPVKFRCEMVERQRLPENPAYKIIDGRTWEIEAESVEKALFFNW